MLKVKTESELKIAVEHNVLFKGRSGQIAKYIVKKQIQKLFLPAKGFVK